MFLLGLDFYNYIFVLVINFVIVKLFLKIVVILLNFWVFKLNK